MPTVKEIVDTKELVADAEDSNSNGNHLLRSNEASELISNKPEFLVRWGITILCCIAACLLAISWFIQYPGMVTTVGSLNSLNSPKEVMVQSGGKLIKLFAKEGQQATANEVLGYMESTARHDEVIALSKLLDTVSIMTVNNQTDDIMNILPAQFNNLGELQTAYQIFSQAFVNFSNYLRNGFYLRKRGMLVSDMSYLQRLHASLQQQKGLLQQDLSLTDTTFKAHEKVERR